LIEKKKNQERKRKGENERKREGEILPNCPNLLIVERYGSYSLL